MKKVIAIILSLFLFNSSTSIIAKEEKNPRRARMDSHLKTVRVTGQSDRSFEDAMNNFNKKKPDGFVIENIQYIKNGGYFYVVVSLRRV